MDILADYKNKKNLSTKDNLFNPESVINSQFRAEVHEFNAAGITKNNYKNVKHQ